MTQRKRLLGLLSLLLILSLSVTFSACGKKTDEETEGTEGTQVEEPQEETVEEPVKEVVKTIDEIDTEGMEDIPLQIESITLFEDGTLRIVPLDDLLKNAETNNEVVDGAIYPFADSGKVKDVFLVRFGDEGYRTIICLMDDGSLSAMSGKELIDDHITVIWDNLTGRDTYVSVEDRLNEAKETYEVVGITEDDEEIDLDFSLDF